HHAEDHQRGGQQEQQREPGLAPRSPAQRGEAPPVRRRTATGAPGGGRRLGPGDSCAHDNRDLACPVASINACCGVFLPSSAFCSSTWSTWLISLYRGTSGRERRLPSWTLAAGPTLGEVASTCGSVYEADQQGSELLA